MKTRKKKREEESAKNPQQHLSLGKKPFDKVEDQSYGLGNQATDSRSLSTAELKQSNILNVKGNSDSPLCSDQSGVLSFPIVPSNLNPVLTAIESQSKNLTSQDPQIGSGVHSPRLTSPTPGSYFSIPTKSSSRKPLNLHSWPDISSNFRSSAKPTSSNLSSNSPGFRNHGKPPFPSVSHSSTPLKLQQGSQHESNCMAPEEQLSTIVRSLEFELQNSGIKVDCSELKTQLIRLKETQGNSVTPSVITGGCDQTIKGGFNSNPNPKGDQSLASQVPTEDNTHLPQHASNQPSSRNPGKPNNWAALFNAQGPSKCMKLEHYPELQQGLNAIVELDETHLDLNTWNHCLIGHFLDGKMPYALLSATTRAAWKENAPISIKQMGACFFFEFKDEASKLKVLEEGPYFFSRRYLVLKEWKRMLIPSTDQPSTISAWIKFHKLPLECWTEVCLSRIASSVGKPLHEDKATANKQRLDYARICVEIYAGDDLPTEVMVKVNGESVVVEIEYQWLPPKYTECKVFGHSSDSCGLKPTCKPSNTGNNWQNVGTRKHAASTGILTAPTFQPSVCPSSSTTAISQDTEIGPQVTAPSSSYAEIVRNATLGGIVSAPLIVENVNTVNKEIESEHKVVSSMLGTLLSNSFHILEEVIPPDKKCPEIDSNSKSSPITIEEIPDTILESEADCESPITPVANATEFLPDVIPAFGGSKKAAKKAAKAARNRSSSKSKRKGQS